MPELPDFESFSDEELELYNQDLQRQRTEIGDVQDALCAVRNRRGAEARAASQLEGLAPSDLDVLIQAATAKMAAAASAAEVSEEDDS